MNDPTMPDTVLVDDYITKLKQRIAELEEFVRFVKIRENGSNYDSLRRQAEKLLQKCPK